MNIPLKYLKVGLEAPAALIIMLSGMLLRLILIGLNWPLTNSDEGTIGIMALHIAYGGEHPTFFYGQNYMGPLEAYLGAGLFHLFGPSLFTLRLGLVLCFALFLASTYLLTSLLYTKKLALCVLILLSLGSRAVLTQQLLAIGGYPETLLFGSLLFLLASWLTLSSAPAADFLLRQRLWRIIGYAGWGLIAGLALWSDLISLPIVAMAGLLLVLFCWRELLKGAVVFLLLGFTLGMLPLIYYNLHALPGQDSWSILSKLRQAGHTALLQQVIGTITVSLPTVTGNPFCPVSDLALFGPSSPQTPLCVASHVAWSLGAIILWTAAALLALLALWQVRSRFRTPSGSFEQRQHIVQQFARLALLASAGLTVLVYASSPSSGWWQSIHSHYLIGVLIAAPAVIFPLWQGAAVGISRLTTRRKQISALLCGGVLLAIGGCLLIGTIGVMTEVPSVEAQNQQQEALIHNLVQIGATRIYTDYWTCDSIAFDSQEHIICGVLDNNLQPTHNRYMPYLVIVTAHPGTSYVFTLDSPQASAIAHAVQTHHMRYRHFAFDGYSVYQPEK